MEATYGCVRKIRGRRGVPLGDRRHVLGGRQVVPRTSGDVIGARFGVETGRQLTGILGKVRRGKVRNERERGREVNY